MQTKRSMNQGRLLLAVLAMVMAAVLSNVSPGSALAATAKEIDNKATQALSTLYKTTPGAKDLAAKAKAVLIFPDITKAGFMATGQFGDGALRKGGKTVATWRSLAVS